MYYTYGRTMRLCTSAVPVLWMVFT